MGKRRGKTTVSSYEDQLRESYRDFAAPKFRFVRDVTDQQPFGGVLKDLSAIGPVIDDTDTNCDVCFTFVVRGEQQFLSVRLSMVGPYAVILSFGADGCGKTALIGSGQPQMRPAEAAVVSVVTAHGFTLVPAHHLETCVPIALVRGREEVTLYAALFEPGAEVPWLDKS
ncbi:hypothetical protein ABZ552_12125 [Nocardia sp. NPDC019219]|uniref:hypothetical protein n=1 Tax=Nocardia sp. NPDC019219 TaxID=3154590 RepID=UPI00340FDB3F